MPSFVQFVFYYLSIIALSYTSLDPLMPLKKGQKWQYKVNYVAVSGNTISDKFTTEVLDDTQQDKYSLALVRNFPTEFEALEHLGYKHLIVYDGFNYYVISELLLKQVMTQYNCCKDNDGLSVKIPINSMFLKKKLLGYESQKEESNKWLGRFNPKSGSHEYIYTTTTNRTEIILKPERGIISYINLNKTTKKGIKIEQI